MKKEIQLIDVDMAKRQIIAFATGCHSVCLEAEVIIDILNHLPVITTVEMEMRQCKGCEHLYKGTWPPGTGWCELFGCARMEKDHCLSGVRKNNDRY